MGSIRHLCVTTTAVKSCQLGVMVFFLNAIDLALYCDHNEEVKFNSLASSIPGHLVANVHYYKQFHTGDVLKDAEGYFKFGCYCYSIVDQIIITTTKALTMNLSIYQKGPHGNIQIIELTTDTRGREVHLKFMCDPHNLTTTMMPFCCLTNLLSYVNKIRITLRDLVLQACSQSYKIMQMISLI